MANYGSIKEVPKVVIDENVKAFGSSIINHYAIEECSELIKELTKDLRNKLDRDHLIEEMADVYYVLSMLKQKYNISDENINENIEAKIIRAKKDLGITTEDLAGDNISTDGLHGLHGLHGFIVVEPLKPQSSLCPIRLMQRTEE